MPAVNFKTNLFPHDLLMPINKHALHRVKDDTNRFHYILHFLVNQYSNEDMHTTDNQMCFSSNGFQTIENWKISRKIKKVLNLTKVSRFIQIIEHENTEKLPPILASRDTQIQQQ